MAINPVLLENLNAAAATCQTAYDAFLASILVYNEAHDAIRKAVMAEAPGVPLVRAGTVEPATNAAISALASGQPFDFAAAVSSAWAGFVQEEA